MTFQANYRAGFDIGQFQSRIDPELTRAMPRKFNPAHIHIGIIGSRLRGPVRAKGRARL